MKNSRVLLLTALASPALLALAAPGAEVAFRVSEGTSLAKNFKSTVQLSLDDMAMTMNGQDPPMMPQIDMSVTTEMEIKVTDDYVSMADGMPKQLKRTFDGLSMHTDMTMEMEIMGSTQNQDMPMTHSSELEGKTVLFTWNADEGEYIASFPDEEGGEDLLDGLLEDMDLRGFLPSGSVSEGESWAVEPAALMTVMAPGGNLKLLPEDVDMDAMMGMNQNFGSMSDWFTEDLRGEVKATFTSMREADGVKLAAIAIEVDISNAVDLTEMVAAAMEDMELPPDAGDIEFDHMDLELEFKGEGTLLWDVAAGHAHSFELSGDFGLLMNMGMAVSAQGMDMDIEQTLEMSGTLNESASFE